jgi:hypothetical protein
MSNYKLLSVGNNAKTVKGDGSEYLTAILYLAPADNLEGVNVCPMAVTAGCKAACLYTAGRGRMSSVQAGRLRKTMLWRDDRQGFINLLKQDIAKFAKYCAKRDIQPVVRLNGTSDIMWEKYIDMETEFPMVQFYDYSKLYLRAYKDLPSNYHLTFILNAHKLTGVSVAVVFRDKNTIPTSFAGSTVIDGDKDDLRFLDMPRSIVALYAKGDAKKDATGFVVDGVAA